MVRFVFQAAVALLATATGVQAYRPGDEICTYASSSSSCSLGSITPSKTDGSVLIYPGGKTRCAFDDYKDAATGFTANATYFFQAFPKPQKKKLALILQGGGACIDAQTCNFALQCSLGAQLVSTRAAASSTGILNATDPNNSFKDWNIVHVPYCTGDLHVGNRVLDAYESGLEALFGRPQCLGQKKKTYLNGFENVKAAFAWAKANYPDVEELVLGGMSAGSLGAQGLALYASDLWSVPAKGIRFGVLADSYIGVLPANQPAGKVLNFYGGCTEDLKIPGSLVAACKGDSLTISDLTSSVIKLLPKSSWLFISSLGDSTQRLFYQLAKDGIAGYPFTNRISETDYFAEVTKIIDVYKSVSTAISTFFVNSQQHVFLNSASYYNTVSTTGDALGAALTKWLSTLGDGAAATTTPPPVSATPTTRPSC